MSDPHNGPLMLCATRILKPPPTTIVKIGPNMNLPRPITVRAAAAGAAGALPGITIGLIIAGFQGLLFGAVFGAMIGVALVTWEPQKGETVGKILGVAAQSRIRRRPLQLDGETVSLSIGIARISRVNEGWVHILPGAVPVNPNEYDERGVYRSPENRNELPFEERLGGLGGRGAFPDHRVEVGLHLPEAPADTAVAVEVDEVPAVDEPAEFTIPAPGAPVVAPATEPAKQRRRRKGAPTAADLTAPIPATPTEGAADTAPVPGTWQDPAPDPTAPGGFTIPAPGAPAHPNPAPPTPQVPVDDFTIPAPGAPAAPEKGGRRRRRRRGADSAPAPTDAWPDPLATHPGAPPAPLNATPAPTAAPAAPPAPPAPPSPPAGVEPPTPRRKRRRGDEEEGSVLDAWPDPLG